MEEGHDVECVTAILKNFYCYEICQRDVRDKTRLESGGRTIVAKDTLSMVKLATEIEESAGTAVLHEVLRGVDRFQVTGSSAVCRGLVSRAYDLGNFSLQHSSNLDVIRPPMEEARERLQKVQAMKRAVSRNRRT